MIDLQADPDFARIVEDKMSAAERVPESISLSRLSPYGKLMVTGTFCNVDDGTWHTIIQQPQSHIVETPGEQTEIIKGVVIPTDPQKLLVERDTGRLALLMSRGLQTLTPDAVTRTKESLLRSEPAPIQTEVLSIEEQIERLQPEIEKSRFLQEKFQSLVRSKIGVKGYVAIEWIEDEYGLFGGSFRVAVAQFVNIDADCGGEIRWRIEDNPKRFTEESIEVCVNFADSTILMTHDGPIIDQSFGLIIEGNDVFAECGNMSGMTTLTTESLDMLHGVADEAVLLPQIRGRK